MNILDSFRGIVATVFVVIVVIGLSWGIARWTAPQYTEIQTVPQERVIDSLTTELHATRINRNDLLDSLRERSHLTDKFRNEIKEAEGTIAQYVRMIGELKLKNDSLRKSAHVIATAYDLLEYRNNNEVGLIDTTLTHSTTWGNGLIGSRAFTYFRNDSVYMAQEIEQLRPVKIDQALIISDDRREVRSIVTSPDFKKLKVESYSELHPVDNNSLPWKWIFAGVGFATGVYVAK